MNYCLKMCPDLVDQYNLPKIGINLTRRKTPTLPTSNLNGRQSITNNSKIPTDLITAYLETDYRVFSPEPFVLKIDHACAQLLLLHRHHQVTSSAFITAWNPYSNQLSQEKNNLRQEQLRKNMQNDGFIVYAGEGKHPSGNWEGEDSLLILGISLEDAKAEGVRWGQNAIVWSDADAIPQLMLLK